MEAKGKINCYVCRGCGRSTHTINLNSGTTPFGIRCPKCNSPEAFSNFYRIGTHRRPEITLEVDEAFYRPTREEFDRMTPEHQDFILGGAMIHKPIGQVQPLPETAMPYTNVESLAVFMFRTYGRLPVKGGAG